MKALGVGLLEGDSSSYRHRGSRRLIFHGYHSGGLGFRVSWEFIMVITGVTTWPTFFAVLTRRP